MVAIAAGGNHNLALRADGTVVGWGENTDAEGVFAGQAVVPLTVTNAVAIGAGEYHSLAVQADGTVVAWGDDSEGQCDVPASLSNAVAVAGGGAHSLALLGSGAPVAWGANWNGQCNLPGDLKPGGIGSRGGSLGGAGGDSLPVPRLLSPVRQGNSFSALVQTLNRKNYALEFKGSLTDTSWTAFSTNAGNGALELLRDPAASMRQRFYRTRQW